MSSGKFGGSASEWSRSISNIMEEMLNRSYFRYRDSGTWQPATNVYETPEHYYICVDLAGLEREAIGVECLSGRVVVVSGQRPAPAPPGRPAGLSVHVLEIDDGAFRREIELPESIDTRGVDAAYDKGFLWVTLPKVKS